MEYGSGGHRRCAPTSKRLSHMNEFSAPSGSDDRNSNGRCDLLQSTKIVSGEVPVPLDGSEENLSGPPSLALEREFDRASPCWASPRTDVDFRLTALHKAIVNGNDAALRPVLLGDGVDD